MWAQEYNVIHCLYCKKGLLKMKMGNQFVVSVLFCCGWRGLSREGARKATLFVRTGDIL